MRSWFLGAVGVCLFATLATDVVRGADKVPFSYSFAKGDTWQYESVDNQQIALNDNMLLNSRITTKFRFDVVEADKESTQVKVSYEAISVDAKRGNQQQSYNSETGEGEGNELKAAVDDLVGRSITLRIMADGTLTDLQGFDAIAASPFGQTFGGFTSDEVFLRSVKLFPPADKLGDHLEVDESWITTDRTEFDPTTTLLVEIDHVVTAVKDNTATIKLHGSADLKSTKEDFDGGIETQAISGEAEWNSSKNRMSKYRLESDIAIFRETPNGRILLAVHQDTSTTLVTEK